MLLIRIENVSVDYHLWRWDEDDFEKPVSFQIQNARVEFNFIRDKLLAQEDRQWAMKGNIKIFVDKPPKELLTGLSTASGGNAREAAQYIYDIAQECLHRLIVYSRWGIGLDSILDYTSRLRFEDLFGEDIFGGTRIFWTLDGEKYRDFRPTLKKTRSKINPLFKSKNLLTPSKWAGLQKFILENPLPSKEMEELLRIRSKVAWNEKRIPTLETAALVEVVVRNKIQEVAIRKGVSKTRIENIEDEIGLSILLNVLLPMALTKGKYRRYRKYINDLDKLRKLRNKIMHKNIPEETMDKETVYKGVVAAIKIVSFLKNKFPD